MKSLLLLKAVFFILCAVGTLPAAQKVIFPDLYGGNDHEAVLVPLDDQGLFATIGVVAADVRKGSSRGETLKLLAQDAQSRITLLKGDPKGAFATTFGSGRDLQPGARLKAASGQSASVLVSWETQFMGRLLPVSFMRLHHTGETPLPGTPLLDENGELVAITHQGTETYGQGMYALPAEAFQRVLADYLQSGEIRSCFCGINLDVRNPLVAVIGVRPESPAAKAGLKTGDVILSIEGRAVRSYQDMINAFFYMVSGQKVSCRYLRGTAEKTVEIVPVADPRYVLTRETEGKVAPGHSLKEEATAE